MTTLTTKNATVLLQNFAAAAQGACSTLLDFTVGSILRATGQATIAVALWLEGLVIKLMAITRLATSTATDVDSFVADFGLSRLAAIPASGSVAFARFTPTNAATIPVGALLQTADGTQQFAVVADATQGAFSAAQNAYLIAAGVTSVSATVQAVTPGTAGNIAAGTLTILMTGISGIDTATNASPFVNAVAAESDAALRARFVAFVASLSKATPAAIGYAITSLRQGLQYTLGENQDYNGTTDYGMVTVIVDDGSGNIPNALLNSAGAAVNLVRAAGIRTGVFAATALTANVTMTIATAAGYVHATVVAQVLAALTIYINNVGLGNPLPWTRLAEVAYDTSAGVIDVTAVLLNSATLDLVPTYQQTIKAGSIVVT